jgi:hypothetical protein
LVVSAGNSERRLRAGLALASLIAVILACGASNSPQRQSIDWYIVNRSAQDWYVSFGAPQAGPRSWHLVREGVEGVIYHGPPPSSAGFLATMQGADCRSAGETGVPGGEGANVLVISEAGELGIGDESDVPRSASGAIPTVDAPRCN